MPILRVAIDEYICERIRLGRVKLLSVFLTTMGLPSATFAIFSPETKLYASTPPQSESPSSEALKSNLYNSPWDISVPSRFAKSANTFTQALISEEQLLQCTIATGSPTGVTTRSISG